MKSDGVNLLIQVAFEIGRAYERLYISLDLYNAINANDLIHGAKAGAQFILNGTMEDLPSILKHKVIENDKLKALNDLANDLQKIKAISLKLLEDV